MVSLCFDLTNIHIHWLLATKRPRPRPVPVKKQPAVRVKKEPTSPPKKGGKRAFSEALDVSDDHAESEDDDNPPPSASGSSTQLQPIVEIPITRRSTRPARQQASKPSKKVRVDAPADQDLKAVLQTQFAIVAEAFRNMGEAISKLQGE